MTDAHDSTQPAPPRRDVLRWLGLGLSGLAALAAAAPVVGYVVGPLLRGRPDEWVDLGPADAFPEGRTRLVDFANPLRRPWDGASGKAAAYVRRRGGDDFLVFAVNCTHLGCPVSWFPQSGLFLCPCHGGVFYEDGEHASGPPPRALYRYEHRVTGGRLQVRAGHLPTLHDPASRPS